MKSFRLFAALLLLALLASPRTRAQATNLPARANSTFGVNTNGVVKVPRNAVYWPTQTNYVHRATITNLTVSAITGVDAGEVAIADGGGYFTGTDAEAALQELGASVAAAVGDVVGITVSGGLLTATNGGGPTPDIGLSTSAVRNATAIYLPLTGGAMSGPLTGTLNIQDVEPGLFVKGTGDDQAQLGLGSTPASYPGNLGIIVGTDYTAAADRAAIYMLAPTSTRGKMVFQTASNAGTLTNALTLDYDQSATFTGAISGNGSGITNIPLATATGDLPAAGFGRTVIQWSMREFTLEEGSTNSVGWTQYTNTSGSRRFTTDAVTSTYATDQIATLRSSIKRVPHGFVTFDSSAAFKLAWASNDSGGDVEIRGITITGWTDLTSTETVLHTDSTVRDVSAAGTPTVVSIASGGFSAGTTVPTYIAIDVLMSLEDGDKAGILVAELISQ